MKTMSLLAVLWLAQGGAAPPSTNQSPASAWERLGRIVSQATNRLGNATTNSAAVLPGSMAELSTDQITRGLKEALARGLDQAISHLGREGGFLTNAQVRIPMPEKLRSVETVLRRFGQDQLADEFVASMNHAAEKAVPAAAGVFAESLKQMTVEDARGILKGGDDAATQYFRRTAGEQLHEKFRPIVAEATAQSGVTSAYKRAMDKAGFASLFIRRDSVDLDQYVTTRATDGLFKIVAEEEKKIRRDPVARTTDLLRSVFGALGRAGGAGQLEGQAR
jgi:hypothetical protein